MLLWFKLTNGSVTTWDGGSSMMQEIIINLLGKTSVESGITLMQADIWLLLAGLEITMSEKTVQCYPIQSHRMAKVGLDGAWIPATTLPAQSKASQTTTTKQQSTQQNTSKANTNSSSSNFLTSTIPSGSYFVVNTRSKKYHYPSCRMVNKISNGNRKYSTNESALQANGYVPCQVCH